MAMFVKICGITSVEDASHAVAAGATALGFVFWPKSPRFVTPECAADIARAVPPGVDTVGVFVDAPIERVNETVERVGLSIVQLHGEEPAEYARAVRCPVLRAVRVGDIASVEGWPAPVRLLIDAIDPEARGGTGARVDWDRAAAVARTRDVVLAGGLTPENVGEAIEKVRPWGVDVSSGVEQAPGVKDPDKVTRFVANATRAYEACR
jgi:phosphoribosylanthranilate isomerase